MAPRPLFGLRPRLALAWLAILWESVWRAFWPAACVAGLTLALALFDVLPNLPGWLHTAVLAVLGLGFTTALVYGVRVLRLPRTGQPLARIEDRSALAHRPLSALRDELGAGRGDAASEALWQAHRRRMRDEIRRLRVGMPAPGVAARDPWAVRAGLVLVLAVAVVIAWGDYAGRLDRALSPHFGAGAATPAVAELWITPPEYTGEAPRFLSSAEESQGPVETQPVPVGSTILARVSGGRGDPVLAVDDHETPLEHAGGGAYQIETKLYDGERLALRQRGHELGAWPIAVVPDKPPQIEFVRDPAGTPRSTLRIDYSAKDDYGIEAVRAIIRRGDDNGGGEPIVLDITFAEREPGKAEGTSYHDLTAHPWAGMPVFVRLEVDDALGQTSRSDRVPIFLPERTFTHPVAKIIVEQRKRLILDPEARKEIGEIMGHLSGSPERFGEDLVVYMGLGVLRDRLRADGSEQNLSAMQKLMWDLALRIEDGGVSLAEQRLRAAQQALRDALQRDASDEEIEALMDQLEKALDEYLKALAQEMQRNPERYQNSQPMDPNATALEGQDLKRMLDQIREMAKSGAKSAAEEMLSQLQSMLENLQMQAQAPPGQNPMGEMLSQLGDLIDRQEELMDRTFEQSQRQQNTPYQDRQLPETQGLADEQEALRQELGELSERMAEMMGQQPGKMGEAQRSMGDAVESLDQRDPGGAVDPQAQALDALRQGGQEMVQQMMSQMGGQAQVGGEPGRRLGGEQDPLGRSTNSMGNIDTSEMKIPDKPDLQRAREILQELRRRAGERGRPSLELDYIERLLERF